MWLKSQFSINNQLTTSPLQWTSCVITALLALQVDLGTSYAVGTIRGNVLLLAPLDGALQLRPSLVHLDEKGAADKRANGAASAAADEAAGGDMEDDDDKAGVMLQVNVRTADCCLNCTVVPDLAQYNHIITKHIIGCFTNVDKIGWVCIYHFVSTTIIDGDSMDSEP